MAKLAIFFNQDSLSGKLTKIFTGSYAYHVAWVCEKEDKSFDMHLIRRRRLWSKLKINKTYIEYDFPMVTFEYLDWRNDTDTSTYGFVDYLLFALKPFYHLFGKSTRNKNGKICSEMINDDLRVCGYTTPWRIVDAPPSPADIERWLKR